MNQRPDLDKFDGGTTSDDPLVEVAKDVGRGNHEDRTKPFATRQSHPDRGRPEFDIVQTKR